MNATLLPSRRARCKHLRAALVIEPATWPELVLGLAADLNPISKPRKNTRQMPGVFSWLGIQDENQTFDEEIDFDVVEIKVIL